MDRIDKEGNIFLKVLPLDKNLTLKLDECGRLYEKGLCVLFPTIWNTWEGFDPYATTIESPFEAGMVGYNEHLNEFGIISDDGSFMTNVDGSRISPIDRLATEVGEISGIKKTTKSTGIILLRERNSFTISVLLIRFL